MEEWRAGDPQAFTRLLEEAMDTGGDIELEITRRAMDSVGINPDRYVPKTPYSPKQNITLSIEEMEGAIEGEGVPSPAEAPAVSEPVPGVKPKEPAPIETEPEAPQAPAVTGPTIPPPAKGVPKRVPRTQAQLEKMLDEWDAQRNRPDMSPEVKAEAKRLQQEAAETLQGLEGRAAASDYGGAMTTAHMQAESYLPPGPRRLYKRGREDYVQGFMARIAGAQDENRVRTSIDYRRGRADAEDYLQEHRVEKIERPEDFTFTLHTARGRETVFTLPPDVNAIGKLRRVLERKSAERKFYSKPPGGGPSEESGLTIVGPVPAGEELPATAAMVEPGERYKDFRQDVYDPDQPATGTAQRRETILKDLMTGLGIPLYQGRIKGRKVRGFYRKGIEEVRIKQPADIETTAHEIAHLLDDRIPEIRRQWNPATKANRAIREELRGVSYDRRKLFEGFAEFVRLWGTQKEEAKARAPKFYAWFEDFVARSEYGPTLRKTQQAMHAWFDQAALDRARSKIGVAEEINDAITRPVDRFRQGVFDDLHGIMRMERELTGELAPVGAYETARLTRGKTALIEGALTLGAPKVNPDGSHGFTGKGLRQILDPVTDRLDDFLMYAVGRSARELRAQGRERLFSKAEIDAMVALKTPAFDKAFDDYQKWNSAILDFAQAKGLINPTARMMWQRTQYLPFHRVGQAGGVDPVPGDWRGIKALTGGTGNLRDILGNMIGNATALIDAALTNEARLEVAKLAKQHGGARFMTRIPTDERSVRVHRSEIERAILEALGVERKSELDAEQRRFVDEITAGLGPFTALTLRGQTPTGRDVVAVLEEGKPVYYEVADPILYRSLTRLNRKARGWFMRVLGGFRRVGQASITLSVDFITANIARDTLMGAVMSRHGFVPIKDSIAGLASRVTQDQNYKDFIANGGGFSSYLLDETAFRKNLERFYRKKGINPRTVMDTPAKLLLGLERIADAFEMSTRLGEFRKARMRGEDPRHAAYSAREVSTDFAMRGDWPVIEFFYDSVMFLKAATNGVDRLYRGLAEDPNRGAIAAKSGLIALVSAGLYAINRDIPLYDDLEDWDRDTHWHFFIPTPETIKAQQEGRPLPAMEDRYVHLRYPKIWEIGAIASITERAIQRIIDDDPKGFGKDVIRVLRDTFRLDPIPQIISPIEELRANRLRFFDRPIETRQMQQLEPWARSGPFTSRTLRAAGEKMRHLPRALQVSPAKAEALLRGYFNTWALYGLSLSDAMFFDDKPDLRIDQYPVLRRFYAREPARHSRHVRELYDLIGKATEVRRTMRHLDRTNRPDMAGEQEFRPENLLFDQLTVAGGKLRVIRKDMAAAVQAPTLEKTRKLLVLQARATKNPGLIGGARRKGAWDDMGELKRLLMDNLLRERNQYAKEVMTEVKGRRRELERAE